MARHGLEEDRAPIAARVVWNALHTPMPDTAGGEVFTLGSLTECRAEVEFLLPARNLSLRPPEEIGRGPGYLNGSIDLV